MFPSVRWSRVILLLLPIFALVMAGCTTQLTPEFSYQGRLLGDSGQPVPDGDYEMTISIYDASSAGNELYSQTQSIPVENGLFTSSVGVLGSMDPELFAQPTWVEVTVEGETLSPRQRLQGSPFAFSLAAGAVVQGEKSRDRDFGGFEDTGSLLTLWNRDASTDGGHALLALNQAAPTGFERDVAAAVLAIAAGGQISDSASDSGAYGAIIRSENYRGLYVRGGRNETTSYRAAIFDSAAGIQLVGGGSCLNCVMANQARNTGVDPIEVGDFVAVSGVEFDAELNIPIMQVQKAAAAGPDVIGVATGRATRQRTSDVYGAQVGGFEEAGGPAAAGDYLSVVVQGMVQANVGAGLGLDVGQRLDDFAATPGTGKLMSAVDKDGRAWVMLSGE